jgi:hypothetical protein
MLSDNGTHEHSLFNIMNVHNRFAASFRENDKTNEPFKIIYTERLKASSPCYFVAP